MDSNNPESRTDRPGGWLRRHRKAILWTGGSLIALAGGTLVLLAVLDWNMLRGPISRYASARTGREIAILGDLDVKPLSWRPSATVHDIRIGNPAWAGKEPMGRIGRLYIQVKALPLLAGHVDIVRLEVSKPDVALVRDAKGRANWNFSKDQRDNHDPLRLPPIQRFVIDEGQLKFTDAKRRLSLVAKVEANERLGAANRGFELTGRGAINREPFLVSVTGGPLLNIDRRKPYPFDAEVRAGSTRVTAKGAIPKPFDLGRFDARFTAIGPDLADLYELIGVPLPNSPPYRLSGNLSREVRLWKISGLGGRVGDSDMAGHLSVDTSGARPFLRGELRSKLLDFDDLAAVFGGAPTATGGETASETQRAVGRQMAAQHRLLPDATLKVDRIRAMDADVTYSAASVRAPRFPIRAAAVHIKLNDGLLLADPLRFDLPQGAIAGQARLDARKSVPVSAIDLRISRARLEQLVPIRAGGGTPLTGGLVGRIKLSGPGNSVREAAANADGEALIVVPGGEIRAAFAELMGINVTKGLGLLLAKDQSKTDLRCAVAHFRASNGVLTSDRIVFDTEPVLGTGEGRIDLRTEQMDFRITGHPKKPRLIRLMAPVTVSGPMLSPKFGVEPSGAIVQGGIAAALGALVTPLAAVLPFVDLGLAKDASCGALIAQAGKQGAPVGKAARAG